MAINLTETNAALSSDLPASATQRVFLELRRQIINGDIAPGERLKIETLKSTLNTGASPIREALSLLTSDQLVERIDQRGFRAAPANKSHFDEILMLRCQLESMALTASIESGSTVWEENLLLAHHRLSKVSRDDANAFETHHKYFHMALLDACGSPILLRFCSQLYDLNIRYRNLAGRSSNYKSRNIATEHEDILQAAINHDTDRASSALRNHYEKTGQLLAGFLERS